MDDEGNPVTTDIPVSFNSLISHAGVSRGSVRQTLDACLEQHFIASVNSPKQKSSGSAGRVGEYRISWNESFTEPFNGFYAGEGRRTPVPHAFFTDVLPHESLAVIRVVGAIIRFTVGFSNQFGGRRKQVALSYSALQSYTHLSRQSLATGIKTAVERGYIQVQERGVFHADQSRQSATTYALKWQLKAKKTNIGSKSLPENRTVQKVDQSELGDGFKILTSNGSKSLPVERFRKLTSKKETEKEHTKQQQVVAENQELVTLLTTTGFDEKTAKELSGLRSQEEIENQIRWMPLRSVRSNALGLLRKAIEEKWGNPKSAIKRPPTAERMAIRQDDQNEGSLKRKERMEFRQSQLTQWLKLSPSERDRFHKMAVETAQTVIERRRLQRHTNLENPSNAALKSMAQHFSDSQ